MQDIETIRKVLDSAQIYGLQVEIVYSALLAIKERPDLSIQDAISFGYYEWIK